VSTFRELFLPYCLDRQADGRYAVLNRRYKPVGTMTDSRERVEYTDPYLVTLRDMTEDACTALSVDGSQDPARIYLYNDRSAPTTSPEAWQAYSARLELLARMRAER
jgi:hypothetical protein